MFSFSSPQAQNHIEFLIKSIEKVIVELRKLMAYYEKESAFSQDNSSATSETQKRYLTGCAKFRENSIGLA